MGRTGIRNLAFWVSAAALLTGCDAGLSTSVNGDPAAAALETAEISTTSLDTAPVAGADGAVINAKTATGNPDTVSASDPGLTSDTGLASDAGAPAARKGLFGFLRAKPKPEGTAPEPLAAAGLTGGAPTGEASAIAAGAAAAIAAADPVPEAATEAVTDPTSATGAALTDGAAAETAPAPRQRKGLFGFLKPRPASTDVTATETATTVVPRNAVRMVDRDVEAPDVFQVTDSGLWDGRPSLGGVWVAYADVTDPERVIIRNADTGAFVIGALFRRERENPGPKLQVSSDAADALGMLAGSPAKLNVTALRREEVADPANSEALLGGSQPVAAAPVEPAADRAPAPRPAQPAADSVAAAAPAAQPAALAARATSGKPFLQVGIFSVESNANGTADTLRKAGLTVQVIKETSHDKTYWRVIIGPADTSAARDALLAKARTQGFADAYFVSR